MLIYYSSISTPFISSKHLRRFWKLIAEIGAFRKQNIWMCKHAEGRLSKATVSDRLSNPTLFHPSSFSKTCPKEHFGYSFQNDVAFLKKIVCFFKGFFIDTISLKRRPGFNKTVCWTNFWQPAATQGGWLSADSSKVPE